MQVKGENSLRVEGSTEGAALMARRRGLRGLPHVDLSKNVTNQTETDSLYVCRSGS